MSARDRPNAARVRAAQRARRGKGEPGRPRRNSPPKPPAAPAMDPTPTNGPAAGIVYGGIRVTPWTAAMLRRRDQGEQQ